MNDPTRRYYLQDYINAQAEGIFRRDDEIIDICREIVDLHHPTPVEKAALDELECRRLTLPAPTRPPTDP
ncbi:hypothetical protein [Sphingobium yanoikuyae]|uniref:hypothetical protein n=1 Tax=Sphingobium yanoikuyae TaxID=13690 RepID=UPI00345EB0F5